MPEIIQWEPYQEVMRQWQRDRDVSGMFQSPGLGKTVVTLDWIDWMITNGHSPGALIVAPIRVGLVTWPTQVQHWEFPSWMRVVNMRTPEGAEAWEKGSAHIYIINFDVLSTREVSLVCKTCKGEGEAFNGIGCDDCIDAKGRRTGRQVRKDLGFMAKFFKGRRGRPLPVNLLVIDELSMFKDPASKRAAALRAWSHKFPYKTGLTGTPAENSYLDLFNEIRMLDDGKRLGASFTAYRNKYFDKDFLGFKWTLKPGAKEEIDKKLADLCLVMLSEDYLDVPTTRAEDIYVKMPEKSAKGYRTLEKKLLVELETGEITALSAAVLANKLLQWTSGTVYDEEKETHVVHGVKIEALRKLLEKHKGEPVLVLTAYKHEMARVLAEIPEARRFHEDDLGDWQKGKIPVWVAQPKSLSHGIDGIQKSCRILVWMTLPYGGGTYIQTNARVIRKGQSAETLIYRILAEDSIDDAVAEILRNKNDEERGLMDALKALQQLRA